MAADDPASIRVNAVEDQSLAQMDVFDNADDEVKQAYQDEVKEEADRKRKADADERLKRGEAYVRLAKLAKGKATSKVVIPSMGWCIT